MLSTSLSITVIKRCKRTDNMAAIDLRLRALWQRHTADGHLVIDLLVWSTFAVGCEHLPGLPQLVSLQSLATRKLLLNLWLRLLLEVALNCACHFD